MIECNGECDICPRYNPETCYCLLFEGIIPRLFVNKPTILEIPFTYQGAGEVE